MAGAGRRGQADLTGAEDTGLGAEICARIDRLAALSAEPGRLTRLFLSPEQKETSALVGTWMRAAGMAVRIDAIGNVVGRREGARPGLPALMLGSHLDTVRDAGRYDGMLGVVTAIACVERLNRAGARLPFAVEVIGFADEEGTRFGAPYLGSRAVAGTFDPAALALGDAAGVTMRAAMAQYGLDADAIPRAARLRDELLAYVELHIEQGPVLERMALPVGCVTGISGATRLRVRLSGEAGHAGTVPMADRRDALAGAAEAILAVERLCTGTPGLVGTVGMIEAAPGAINVIPGAAMLSVDMRSPDDRVREATLAALGAELRALAGRRGLALALDRLSDSKAAPCAPWLVAQIHDAIAALGVSVHDLPSGAGHDAAPMSAVADIGMIFVRCERGVSHHPAEAITVADADMGARVLLRVIEGFRAQRGG
jgi:allantoate deiminase